MSSLDDIKSVSQNDSSASKAIALDHLGVIACRLRSNAMKVEKAGLDDDVLIPLDEVPSSPSRIHFLRLIAFRW